MTYALSDSVGHRPFASRVGCEAPDDAEVRAACSGFEGVVLATETGTTPVALAFDDPEREPFVAPDDGTPGPLQAFEGKPLVAYAVAAALDADLAHVTVLAGGDDVQRAAVADAACAELAARAGCDAVVETVAFDAARAREATRAAAGFEFNSIEKGVLDYAARAVGKDTGCPGALLLDCSAVRITAGHLALVAQELRDDESLDAATSWITWAPRLPIALSARFLASLDDAPFARACGPAGMRPLPRLNVREVVFGEESVSAPTCLPRAAEEFFDGRMLCAREAVRRARTILQGDGGEDASGGEGQGCARELNAADALLVETAREVVSLLDARVGGDFSEEIAWADAWARTNGLSFPLLNDRRHAGKLAYLDSAATTQRLSSALAAQAHFDAHENANVYRGAYDLSLQATLTLNDARKELEDFIGAERRETVLAANASAALSLAAQAWGERNIGEGDAIVLPVSEHHSNFLPWLMLAKRKGARVVSIPVLGDGHLDMEAYGRALCEGAKLVCVAHVSNVLGIVNPVRQMADAAHEAGARILVDAAQSMAHLALNVRDLHADFVAFSAHKMYAPAGLGGLWVSPEAFAEMDPVTAGGGTISHVALDSYYLRQGAIQYELGTPPVALAAGWAAAIGHLRTLGMENVERHGRALTRYLACGLPAVPDVTVWGSHNSDDELAGLVSFSLCGVTPAEVGQTCGKLGVAIRSGSHCAIPLTCSMGAIGTARASLGIHTTREDVEALIVAVAVCRKLYETR